MWRDDPVGVVRTRRLEGCGTPEGFADSALLRPSPTWVSVTPYLRPRHLKGEDRWQEGAARLTGIALRLKFSKPVPGPIALGFGSHFDIGLFRAVDEGPAA